eukprot:tig00020961_g16707.t1
MAGVRERRSKATGWALVVLLLSHFVVSVAGGRPLTRESLTKRIEERGISVVGFVEPFNGFNSEVEVKCPGPSSEGTVECPHNATRVMNAGRLARGVLNGRCRPCSYLSRAQKRQDTLEARTGHRHALQNPETRERQQDTLEARTGHRHAMHNPESVLRMRDTLEARTGYRNPMHNPESVRRQQDTLEARTGHRNAMHNPESVRRQQDTLEARTGHRHSLQNPETRERQQDTLEARTGYRHALQNPEILERVQLASLMHIGAIRPHALAGSRRSHNFRYADGTFAGETEIVVTQSQAESAMVEILVRRDGVVASSIRTPFDGSKFREQLAMPYIKAGRQEGTYTFDIGVFEVHANGSMCLDANGKPKLKRGIEVKTVKTLVQSCVREPTDRIDQHTVKYAAAFDNAKRNGYSYELVILDGGFRPIGEFHDNATFVEFMTGTCKKHGFLGISAIERDLKDKLRRTGVRPFQLGTAAISQIKREARATGDAIDRARDARARDAARTPARAGPPAAANATCPEPTSAEGAGPSVPGAPEYDEFDYDGEFSCDDGELDDDDREVSFLEYEARQILEYEAHQMPLAYYIDGAHHYRAIVPRDGDCLFHAVHAFLHAHGLGLDRHTTPLELRQAIVDHAATRREEIEGILARADDAAATTVAGDFDEHGGIDGYLERMREAGAWGGIPEVAEVANMIGIDVAVYRVDETGAAVFEGTYTQDGTRRSYTPNADPPSPGHLAVRMIHDGRNHWDLLEPVEPVQQPMASASASSSSSSSSSPSSSSASAAVAPGPAVPGPVPTALKRHASAGPGSGDEDTVTPPVRGRVNRRRRVAEDPEDAAEAETAGASAPSPAGIIDLEAAPALPAVAPVITRPAPRPPRRAARGKGGKGQPSILGFLSKKK